MTVRLDFKSAAAGLAAFAAFAPVAAHADKAIVVGVNKYPKLRPGHDLEGCVNDAKSMATVFRSYGFEVAEVYDQNATKQGILSAIRGMKLAPNERFVFYFAGHGTADTEGDKGAVLPNDARDDSADNDLKCQELYTAVKSLPGRSKTVVLDSCYSAAMSKGFVIGVPVRKTRYYARNLRRDATREFNAPANNANANEMVGGPGICYFTAARENEPANEIDFQNTRHGVFTYFLTDALTKARAQKAVWSDVQKVVTGQVVSKLEDLQHPTLSPAFAGFPIFDNAKDTPQPNPNPNPPTPPKPQPVSNLWDEINGDAVDKTKLQMMVDPNKTTFKVGDHLRFKATVGPTGGYLVVLEKGTSGKINLLYPEIPEDKNKPMPTSAQAKVGPNQVVRIPSEGNDLEPDSVGTEYVKAILFTNAEDADQLLKRIPREGLTREALRRDFNRVRVSPIKSITSDFNIEILAKGTAATPAEKPRRVALSSDR